MAIPKLDHNRKPEHIRTSLQPNGDEYPNQPREGFHELYFGEGAFLIEDGLMIVADKSGVRIQCERDHNGKERK